MGKWEHLAKAPITEALIDIRVILPSSTTLETLEGVQKAIQDQYPNCRKRRSFTAQFSVGETTPPALDVHRDILDGLLMSSKDGLQIVQARLDGFTFSRLHPYESWEQLRDDTKVLWQTYCQVACPVSVSRIAVRYLNRLNLPVPVGNLKDWLLTGPEVSPKLPQALAGYYFRIQMPFTDPTGYAFIHQKVDAVEAKETIPVIFDIDAFLPIDIDPSSPEMWKRFEDLHTIKNKVFFGSLANKTLELYR